MQSLKVMRRGGIGGGLALAAALAMSGPIAAQDESAVESPLTGAELVGDWTWRGDDPLTNRARPGTNDATAVNDADAMDGLAVVRGNEKPWNDDEYFEVGSIESTRGATGLVLTFEDVVLEDAPRHVLMGAMAGGAADHFEGSSFYVDIIEHKGSRIPRLVLWGEDASGEMVRQDMVYLTAIQLEIGEPFDLQVVWDGTDMTGRNVRGRSRGGDSPTWGGFVEKPSSVRKLADADPPFRIGKYSKHSSVVGDSTFGRVTLHVR